MPGDCAWLQINSNETDYAAFIVMKEEVDLRGLKVVAGDYNLKGLSERTNTEELNTDIVKTWLKHAQGRRTVAFAVDIAHSQAIAQAFQGAGIAAEHKAP